MTLPTQPVTCTANDQNGNPVPGARFQFKLTGVEYSGGFVVPELTEVTADASGVAIVNLWPNSLGVNSTLYSVKAFDPTTGRKYLDTFCTVPNSPALLHLILTETPPAPIDASTAAMNAAQAAVAGVTTQAGIATAQATAAAASATGAAGSATAAAGSATAASGSATGASGSATAAGASQAAAGTSATNAAASAAGAVTSATSATGSATAASGSAATAAGSVTSAAAQAVAAAASATGASTSAGTATTQASLSAGSAVASAADAAATLTNRTATASSAAAAATSATGAAGSATAAGNSATAAAASAGAAAGSANTATTQAASAAASAATVGSAATTTGTNATAAAASAAAASTSATNAATSEANALASKTAASTSSTNALTRANAADASATAAAASAVTSSSQADISQAQAVIATAQAASAAVSTTNAGASATAAAASASAASGSASTSSAQSVVATTQAGNAATSATASAGSATASATSATAATTNGAAQVTLAAGQVALATTQAGNAAASATAATTNGAVQVSLATVQAINSAASATSANTANAGALAIYGTTAQMNAAQAIMLGYANTATAQAGLAASSAAAAASVAQQDLSGVTAAALHRSPNAVTALFVYDTSKDSDGGAWIERMQNTSWFNEALNGPWRGWLADEAAARAIAGTATGDYFGKIADGKFYKLWNNLFSESEFRNGVTDAPSRAGLVTATALSGYAGALAFGYDGATTSSALKTNFVPVVGNMMTISVVVAMTDTLAPTFAGTANSAGNDFALFTNGTGLDPVTYPYVVTNLGGGIYRVTVAAPAAGNGNASYGVQKYSTNSNRTFKVTAFHLNWGSSFTGYEVKTADGTTTEVFRGNTAKFPRLAAIVAEASNVTIYDLTAPGRPMACRWEAAANNMVQGTVSSLAAMNGCICVGSNSGAFIINMAKDSASSQSTSTDKVYKGNVAQRGGANGYL
jgi:hypothetical protein